ncbi:16760_t:CDS:2, partial [Racocetra fulgida]
MADIHFYKLPALKKQTLPICAFFKSPFNEDWRLDITLSLVKPKDLTLDKEIVLSIHRDGYSIVQFHATDVLWDLVSPQQSYFQFTQQADIYTLRQISKTFRPMYDDNSLFYGCETGPSLYNIDDVDMPGKDVYHNIFNKSRELVKPMVGKCVRVYLTRAIFSLRIPDVPVYGVMNIIPMWGGIQYQTKFNEGLDFEIAKPSYSLQIVDERPIAILNIHYRPYSWLLYQGILKYQHHDYFYDFYEVRSDGEEQDMSFENDQLKEKSDDVILSILKSDVLSKFKSDLFNMNQDEYVGKCWTSEIKRFVEIVNLT